MNSGHSDAIEQTVAVRMRAEQLRLLYRQSQRMEFVSPMVGGAVCIGMWSLTDHALLLGWLLLLSVTTALRLLLARGFERSTLDAHGGVVWERRFVLSLGWVGVLWGVGGLLLMPADSLVGQSFVFFFLVGMAGGVIATFAVHVPTVRTTVTAMVGPAVLYFMVAGETIRWCMAFGGSTLIWAAPRGVQLANDILRKSLLQGLQLEQLARVDALSGLANRRALTEAGEAMVAAARRDGRCCAVLMIDIDHFKAINDSFGHAGGDAVIANLGRLLRGSVRAGETAGRMGGEEFALLLPDGARPQGRVLAERLLGALRAQPTLFDGQRLQVSVSIGIADSDGWPATTFSELLGRADTALYQAKNSGRNRWVEAPDAEEAPVADVVGAQA